MSKFVLAFKCKVCAIKFYFFDLFVGQEYSLLFISTVEGLEPSGRPFDVVKSFCHPAVFNTAITRSKSLVVAVGNPIVLMMSEGTMNEPKWCWREFITRCLNEDTFIIPHAFESLSDKIENLFQKLLKSRQTSGKHLIDSYIFKLYFTLQT